MLPGRRPFFLSFVSDGPFLSARQRKDELEQRMSALQESRRELMVQLEGLMKLLKVRACSGAPPAASCLVHLPPQGSSASPVTSNRRRRKACCCCLVPVSRYTSTAAVEFRVTVTYISVKPDCERRS